MEATSVAACSHLAVDHRRLATMRATGTATTSSAAGTTTTAPFSSFLPCLRHRHVGAEYVAAACLAIVIVTFLAVAASLDPNGTSQAPIWFQLSSSSSSSSLQRQRGRSGGGAAAAGELLLATSTSYSSSGPRNSTGKEVHKEVLRRGANDDQDDDDGLLSSLRRPWVNYSSSPGAHGAPDDDELSVAPPPAARAQAPVPPPEPAKETAGDASQQQQVIRQMRSRRRKDAKLERLELGLAKARSAIMEAIQSKPDHRAPLPDPDYVPVGPIYRNAYAFHRSYLEMEKLFKVYVYEEGEPPVFHDGPCRSIYSTEGRFIYNMEMMEEGRMRTRDPGLAHVFFLPFSVVKMVKMIYEPSSRDMGPIRRTISDYVGVVAAKHPYWNRSLGADHFMLSCHDWGPYVSSANGHLYSNAIRVLCNANRSEGFDPTKDVSLPEINLRTDAVDRQVGGPSASRRPILAFFAGGNHGPVRPALLRHWKDRDDPDGVRVSEYLPRGVSYTDMIRRSRFCLCPGGYEVASPRLAEAIYLECVPVVVDDGDYALPFADVLNWDAFSVRLRVADIPRLKDILAAVSPTQYIRLQRRVRMVRRHFMVHGGPPRRYDAFHMTLHSVWLRRLNVRVSA